MLSPGPRRPDMADRRERSPFSSPFSNIQNSPVAARRGTLEERRRPAGKFESAISPLRTDAIDENDHDEDDEDDEDGDQDDDVDEDDEDNAGELSPLLPIFSAAHLGIRRFLEPSREPRIADKYRFFACLQHNPRDSPLDHSTL